MITASILNSTASLNDFDVIGSLEFIPGAPFTLVIRLEQDQRLDALRYIPDISSSLVIYLPKKDGTDLAVNMTVFTDDRSIWSAQISQADSEDLASGNITFDLTDNGVLRKGWIQNGLQLQITGDC
jgi:hypothetical protein